MLKEYGTPADSVWTTTRFIYEDGIVSLFLHDFGKNVREHFGSEEYEKTLILSAIDSEVFVEKIGINGKHEEEELKKILHEKLKTEDNDYVRGFRNFCEACGLKIISYSYSS